MCPEILNPEFKVGTLNSKTSESGEFCFVNDFLSNRLSNPDIFLPAIFWVCGKTQMEDLVLRLLAVSGCLILLQVQAVNLIMCNAIFRRKRKLLSQGSLTTSSSVQLKFASGASGSTLPFFLFWRHFCFVERRNNTELGNHSITNALGVVVVCKRSGIRISFQCNRLRIRILLNWWIRKH